MIAIIKCSALIINDGDTLQSIGDEFRLYDNKNVQYIKEELSSKFVPVLHSSVHLFQRITILVVSQVNRRWITYIQFSFFIKQKHVSIQALSYFFVHVQVLSCIYL